MGEGKDKGYRYSALSNIRVCSLSDHRSLWLEAAFRFKGNGAIQMYGTPVRASRKV